MQLTYAQKLEFYRKGYVRIPGVVPVVMVDAAVKAINHSFGNGIDPEKMITFQAQSFCPELRQASEIIDLYNRTPVRPLAESMIGEGKVDQVSRGRSPSASPFWMIRRLRRAPTWMAATHPTTACRPASCAASRCWSASP